MERESTVLSPQQQQQQPQQLQQQQQQQQWQSCRHFESLKGEEATRVVEASQQLHQQQQQQQQKQVTMTIIITTTTTSAAILSPLRVVKGKRDENGFGSVIDSSTVGVPLSALTRDEPTDGLVHDGAMYKPSYRDARTHQKDNFGDQN